MIETDFHIGDTVLYVLRELELPVNPEKQWRGKVLKVTPTSVVVASLEEGYEGFTEVVFFKQIFEVKHVGENKAENEKEGVNDRRG